MTKPPSPAQEESAGAKGETAMGRLARKGAPAPGAAPRTRVLEEPRRGHREQMSSAPPLPWTSSCLSPSLLTL